MRVVLADDHSMFRQGLSALLHREGFQVVGEAADGNEAVRLTRELQPDAIVIDLNMSGLNGLEATRRIAEEAPATQGVLLTMFEDEAYVLEALQAGVRGYVLKSQATTDLIQALAEVGEGKVYLSPGIAGTVVAAYLLRTDQNDEILTSKERQVLQLVAEGNTTKQIARLLNLAIKTVESHRNRLMQKLDVGNTAGLVRHAVRQGLVRP